MIGARLIPMAQFGDDRGPLSVCEELPFEPKRAFVIRNEGGEWVRRGGHAHRTQSQLIIAAMGTITAEVRRSDGRAVFGTSLYGPSAALLVPPLLWLNIGLEGGAAAVVMASDLYDEAEYIRDESEFFARPRA